jgi:hypothetical protein
VPSREKASTFRALRFLFHNMKTAQKKTAGAKSAKAVNGKTVKDVDTETVADKMDALIFRGETNPERRIETLELWRCRRDETRNQVFQQDLERMAVAMLEEQDAVDVMLPVTLTVAQWQRLIALGADAARENLKGIAIGMPSWGLDGGPLGDVVSAVLEKTLGGGAQ